MEKPLSIINLRIENCTRNRMIGPEKEQRMEILVLPVPLARSEYGKRH